MCREGRARERFSVSVGGLRGEGKQGRKCGRERGDAESARGVKRFANTVRSSREQGSGGCGRCSGGQVRRLAGAGGEIKRLPEGEASG